MSLLTKEQQRVVEAARATIREDEAWGGRSGYEASLVAIIDDIQSRAPKQYTEQELREAFERPRLNEMRKHGDNQVLVKYSNGEYIVDAVNLKWHGMLECARFLGALKEGP